MKFAEVHKNDHRSVGHWLFLPGSMSAFHRVSNCEEVWAIHAGGLILHLIDTDGAYTQLRVGLDLRSGEIPVVTIPSGTWPPSCLKGWHLRWDEHLRARRSCTLTHAGHEE